MPAPASPDRHTLNKTPARMRLSVSQLGMRRYRTSTIAARLAAAVAAVDATRSIRAVGRRLGPGRRDAARQVQEPGVDVAAEDPDADQHHDRNRGDQQAILDHVLTIFFVYELTNQ